MRESKNTQEPFGGNKQKNRAEDISLPKKENFSVTLYDVDLAIMEYMRDVVLPELDEDGTKIKVPVLYGNPERWKSARKDGVLRDVRGRLQLPLVMYKRNSIERSLKYMGLNSDILVKDIKILLSKPPLKWNAWTNGLWVDNFTASKIVFCTFLK